MSKKKKNINKEFGLSSWAINNKTTIYVMMAIILFLGISAYFSMPRENFPEIKETKIYVSSVFPGNTAEDIEKFITTPLEDKLKTLEFYTKKLNFVDFGSNEFDYYLIIKKDNIEIHFFLHNTLSPSENYGQIYIRVNNIQEVYNSFLFNNVEIHPNGKLELKPWDQWEFSILDPDNNLLTFGESA